MCCPQKLMGKIKTTTCETTKGNKHRKNTTSSSEIKYIFYSPNTTHEWFRFKKRFEVYLFRLTFSRIISILAILLSQCLFVKRFEKKNSHNSDDSLPINCLSSANQQCVQPVSVTVFFFQVICESKLSEVVFKTSQTSHS